MEINEIQDSIIEEFSVFDDWLDKYNYIIELAKDLPVIDEKYKTKDYLIDGCQSKVWINAEYKDGKVFYTADSDAIITKGIIALLLKVFNNHTPKEIIDADIYFINEIGLEQNLSPTRANGLVAMLKKIKLYALAFSAKEEKN